MAYLQRRRRALVAGACAAALASGSVEAAGEQDGCFRTPTTQRLYDNERRTVVITDPVTLRLAGDFSLGRTLGAIVSTAAGSPAADTRAERIALLTSMVRSFRAKERINPDSGVPLPVQPRAGEGALDPLALLDEGGPDGMRAVGLFNRFDLAPASWRHCGEHRIVYAKGDPENPLDRFFLIFEAAVDNPSFDEADPAASREGCRPVAEFWDGLGDMSGPDLAQALETFYYGGLDADGDGRADFRPVVHFAHFGVPLGQVRGNLFVTQGDPQGNRWQLREWRVVIGADSAPSFAVDTVKKNPFPPLYGPAAEDESEGVPDLRTAFNDEFVAVYTEQLTSLDAATAGSGGGVEDGNRLLLELGAEFENRFNGFQSVSQGRGDDPLRLAEGAELPDRITGRLDELGRSDSCGLTPEHVLNRAGALSCGGCHQFSAGQAVAPDVAWPGPAPGGFVHVTEQGVLSPALEDHFLPGRRENLERFLAEAPAVAAGPARPMPAAAPEAASAEQPEATVGPEAKAASAVQQRLESVRASETRLEAIDALRALESEVNAVRAEDQREPGAFVTYRRAH